MQEKMKYIVKIQGKLFYFLPISREQKLLYLILLKNKRNKKPHHDQGSISITTKPKSCQKFTVYAITTLE